MKVYESRRWMERKYIQERLSEQEIAKLCSVSQATINRWLKKHGIHKKQR